MDAREAFGGKMDNGSGTDKDGVIAQTQEQLREEEECESREDAAFVPIHRNGR
jgi:hypothetical protein